MGPVKNCILIVDAPLNEVLILVCPPKGKCLPDRNQMLRCAQHDNLHCIGNLISFLDSPKTLNLRLIPLFAQWLRNVNGR
jgi:hypothetical protein